MKHIEEVTGGITGAIVSSLIYNAAEVANHAINTFFVLLNTSVAVLGAHYLKKWLQDKKDIEDGI